jgi:hypothetical protein
MAERPSPLFHFKIGHDGGREVSMMKATGIGFVCALLLMATSAGADDFAPPLWRGFPNTTWGQWEFGTDDQTPPADDGFFAFGDPSMTVTPGTNMGWLDDYEGRQGVWQLSGWFDVTLQNDPVERPFKDIWLQLTWFPQNETAAPVIEILDPEVSEPFVTTPTDDEELSDGWHHTVFHFQIFPNPAEETLRVQGAINVDEVVIDTRCVPEPATLVLVVTGSIGVILLRRRHP